MNCVVRAKRVELCQPARFAGETLSELDPVDVAPEAVDGQARRGALDVQAVRSGISRPIAARASG